MQLISEIAADLGRLSPGDRFWFWLCPTLPVDESPLRVTRLAEDPGRDRLEKMCAAADVGPIDCAFRGIGAVLQDGRLSFGAPGLSVETLRAVAVWVDAHVFDEIGLAVLKDALFLDVGPDGTVREEHQDPELWVLAAQIQQAQRAAPAD